MMDMMSNGHASMMGGMWFISMLFWVLIIAGVILIAKWFFDRDRDNNESGEGYHKESALDVLKKRYARGEIDRETFETMKKDITG